MTALANFRRVAMGEAPVEQEHSPLPDTTAPGVSITRLFPYQSYFDDALLEQAILQQSRNQPIVNSVTPAIGAPTQWVQSEVAGYALGLHPSSETPVAVLPLVGGQASSPQPVILKPGQIYRPHGKPLHGVNGSFSAVNWGLPFGWLGGGLATLYIFSSPDADAAWPGNKEVIFHRQRMRIYTPTTAVIPAAAPYNWPLRFPWMHAIRGADDIDQSGAGVVQVEPTRTLMSLRLEELVDTVDMRIYVQSSNDMDLDANGVAILTNSRFIDYTWGSYSAPGAALVAAAPNLANQFPVDWMPDQIVRMAADGGGVFLWSDDPNGELGAEAYADITRYGRL